MYLLFSEDKHIGCFNFSQSQIDRKIPIMQNVLLVRVILHIIKSMFELKLKNI